LSDRIYTPTLIRPDNERCTDVWVAVNSVDQDEISEFGGNGVFGLSEQPHALWMPFSYYQSLAITKVQ
jgi:hypothetical protein